MLLFNLVKKSNGFYAANYNLSSRRMSSHSSGVEIQKAMLLHGEEIGRMNLTSNDLICIVRKKDLAKLKDVPISAESYTNEITLIQPNPAEIVSREHRVSHGSISMFKLLSSLIAGPWIMFRSLLWKKPKQTSDDEAALIERYWKAADSNQIEIKTQ